MLIQQEQNGSKGVFFVSENNRRLAQMTYTMPSADRMIIDHTEVNDELRGKNVGYQLVNSAVEYARVHNVKITPLCPFASSVFKKKRELADVLFNN